MKYSHEVAGLKADIDLIETDLSGKLYPLNPKDFFLGGAGNGAKTLFKKRSGKYAFKSQKFFAERLYIFYL